MSSVITDSPDSVLTGDQNLESSISTNQKTSTSVDHHQPSFSEQISSITDVSPTSALTTEETMCNLLVVCGDECVPTELVQPGVYRSFVSPHKAGLVDLHLSFDGQKSISQVAHLLFSTSRRLGTYSTILSQSALKEAKLFAQKTSQISNGWASFLKYIKDNKLSFPQAKDNLFELTLKNRLRD